MFSMAQSMLRPFDVVQPNLTATEHDSTLTSVGLLFGTEQGLAIQPISGPFQNQTASLHCALMQGCIILYHAVALIAGFIACCFIVFEQIPKSSHLSKQPKTGPAPCGMP